MDPKGLRVTQNAYFSLLTHTEQLLLVTYCDPTAGIVKWDGMGQQQTVNIRPLLQGWTDVKVEIVI